MKSTQYVDQECAMFAAPPINELVLGIYYPAIIELKAQHIGVYWKTISDRYPNCEQQSVVGIQAEGQSLIVPQQVPDELFPLPRFWFSSKENTLIQVQRNGFLVNWRRDSKDDEYPRYDHMEKLFWRELENYKDFVQSIGGAINTVRRCELVYTNLITPNVYYTNHTTLGRVIPPVASLTEAAIEGTVLSGINATVVYEVNNHLAIESVIRSGRRADTMETAAMLDLKLYGAPNDFSFEGAEEWFQEAHKTAYKAFRAYTDEKVQTEIWRRS